MIGLLAKEQRGHRQGYSDDEECDREVSSAEVGRFEHHLNECWNNHTPDADARQHNAKRKTTALVKPANNSASIARGQRTAAHQGNQRVG